MARKIALAVFLLLLGLALLLPGGPALAVGPNKSYLPMIFSPLKAPVLRWAYGGCTSYSCETGWYSSPAVADVNGDGKNEVLASAYTLWALNGDTGAIIWSAAANQGRTWPGVVVADIDKDGKKEILVAQGNGYVSAYKLDGSLKWQKRPAGTSEELRGLLVADLDGNNSNLEVVVTRAAGSATNTWVLDSSGNTRSGWSQLSSGSTKGYAWGVYNANAAAGNISGDGKLELIVPSDVHYINAYEPDGSSLQANTTDYPNKYWGLVGVWENLAVEKRGWGACDGVRAESYRANFADGPATISDVDGDGKREVVVTGNMYDCSTSNYQSKYIAPFIFNADRSRFVSGAYDWSTNPVDTGIFRTQDYNIIETAESNPVTADLDGDGKKEILFSAYDGLVHAFWLDKTEHGSWPFAVYKTGDPYYSFASEPLVADLDNDGKAEVIFTTWTQHDSHLNGKLYILDWTGKPIYTLDLPAPRSWQNAYVWNGGMGAPTLAKIGSSPDLALIINTAHSGVVVYDLPGTAGARILWGTGRGDFNRDGNN